MTPIIPKIHALFPHLQQREHFDHTMWIRKCFEHMASILPMGEKTVAVSGICNREETTANFCYWTKEAMSIHLQGPCRQYILLKMFCVPQAEQFHICPAVAA